LSGQGALKELPEWISHQTGLQMLDLGECLGLTELPASLGALAGLRELNLEGCGGLTELPAWLGALTGLQTLDLEGCDGLGELPAWLGALKGTREHRRDHERHEGRANKDQNWRQKQQGQLYRDHGGRPRHHLTHEEKQKAMDGNWKEPKLQVQRRQGIHSKPTDTGH
jgi:hypothetical protein